MTTPLHKHSATNSYPVRSHQRSSLKLTMRIYTLLVLCMVIILRCSDGRKPMVERTTKPMFERTTKPMFERTTKPMFERTTKPKVERTTKPKVERTTKPMFERTTKPKVERTTKPMVERTTAFESRIRCTMRGFGEPHIETCNAPGTSVRCYAPGIQTYLDIFYLRMTVLHTVLRRGVTVITEVRIDFKSIALPHRIMYTYRASGGILPTNFEYKADSISAIDSVILERMGPRGVLLRWPFTQVIISIDSWGGRLYQITVRGPRAVMNTGIGMLIQGCPDEDRVPRIVAPRISRARARAACLANKVPAMSLDMEPCIFDVRITGDIAIADAAGMAVADKIQVMNIDANLRRGYPIRGVNITSRDDVDVTLGVLGEKFSINR